MRYMRKHEHLEPYDDTVADKLTMPIQTDCHGISGPIHTSYNGSKLPIEDSGFQAAAEVCGMPGIRPEDPCDGNHFGFFNCLGAVARTGPLKGKRSYAANGYFELNQGRQNLSVICDSLVSKVLLEDGTAKGLEFVFNDETYTVSANREVLLSCGVIQSPQILELSGIGDPDILQRAGVECKLGLPGVGANFQDHFFTGSMYDLTPGNISLDIAWDPTFMAGAQTSLLANQDGPLTSIMCSTGFFPYKRLASTDEFKETIASIRKTQQDPSTSDLYKRQLDIIISNLEDTEGQNLQLVFIPASSNWESGVLDQSTLATPLDPSQPHGVAISAAVQYPVSRGTVHITSSGSF